MPQLTDPISSSTGQAPVRFLLDWRDDHRHLSDGHRDAAGRYIAAIVNRDPRAQEDARIERAMAIELWSRFRETYDGYVGPYMKSAREDVARALGRL